LPVRELQELWIVAGGAPAGVVTLTGVSAASIKAETTAAQSAAPPIVERLLIALTLSLRATGSVAASTQHERLCRFPPSRISAVGRIPEP
jgi:hypothetical protein